MEKELVFQIKDPGTNEFNSRRLTNQEAPAYPDFVDEELVLAVGRDRFGDPLMRIAWGQRLFRIVNGQKLMLHPCQSWQANGEIHQIGYPRFIVQQKMDPVFVGLETWDEALQGPKPYKGMYVFLACVQTTEGHFRLPDRILLEALKGLDFNRRHETLYGSHMEPVPEKATEWKLTKLMSDINEREEKYREKFRDNIKQAFKERGSRLFHNLPNEGRIQDPYALAKRARQRAHQVQQARLMQPPPVDKKIVLTDFIK